jgi:tRNA dimethylallyltransferase
LPEVAPNKKLRSMLRSKSTTELFKMLKKLDPRRAANIDSHNPARLIRAIEIIKATGQAIPMSSLRSSPSALILGIRKDQNDLYRLIDKRLDERLKDGLIAEIKKLHKSGVSWKRLQDLGLEYRFGALHLQGYLTYDEMVEQLKHAIHKFSVSAK